MINVKINKVLTYTNSDDDHIIELEDLEFKLNRRSALYLTTMLLTQLCDELEELDNIPFICATCYSLGYLEVCTGDDEYEIQACQTCDHFGIIGDTDKRASELASIEEVLK